MTVVEALNLRAGFANIKRQLTESGVDISDVKSITDLPAVMACVVPDSLVEKVDAISTSEVFLATMLNLLQSDAVAGTLAKLMTLPSDEVNEEDLNA